MRPSHASRARVGARNARVNTTAARRWLEWALRKHPVMTALDSVLPTPRLLEVESVDLAIPPARVWQLIRHGHLPHSPLVRALFYVRTLPERMAHLEDRREPDIRLDDMVSSPELPGFQVLIEDAPHEVVVGAIGKVWHLDIPFVHVEDADAFAAFEEPDYVKVAWAIQLAPLGDRDTRLSFEVRVDATDDRAWKKFKRYFALIGPGSRFIRRSITAALAREYGTPESKDNERPLPGDVLLPDANVQFTDGITIAATPAQIWPWLVQMGCRRAGFYAIDALDNGGKRSAREIHPELQDLHIGEVIPATPRGDDGFEVLWIEPERALVLGGLFDVTAAKQLAFASERPKTFRHMTWSFVLEPLDAGHTRLHARVRAAHPPEGRLEVAITRPVHHLMQGEQLRHLAARAEGRLRMDDARDVIEGVGGAAIMVAAMLTPFARHARSHWGLDEATAARVYPGDELIEAPRWSWTHGIEIEAAAEDVWPWIAQVGADRGGFYSYQWLENVAGCRLHNAEAVHAEWAVREGDGLLVHPKMPPLPIVAIEPGKWFVAGARGDRSAPTWVDASWLFFVEPLGPSRSRFISRYRCACSDDLATRLSFGPTIVEPIGFAMDRRMLLGVKHRVELARARRPERVVRMR
jgi:hypothetical protein